MTTTRSNASTRSDAVARVARLLVERDELDCGHRWHGDGLNCRAAVPCVRCRLEARVRELEQRVRYLEAL